MGLVQVKGLMFHALHGCHPSEKEVGGRFEVDIDVTVDLKKSAYTDNLADTVDYVVLMDIASAEMKKRRDLIETVAQDIAEAVKAHYPRSGLIEVTIKKHAAPVIYDLNYVAVKAVV
jgi:dihydroneopterin aldolase